MTHEKWTSDCGTVTLWNADCFDMMQAIHDSSVSLVLVDPPYFKVKDDWWDKQWESVGGFCGWIGRLCDEWRRVLMPNGSLYVFASPNMAWHVEGEIRRRFNVLNRIVWRKEEGIHWRQNEESLRSYFPQTEAIVFAEQFGADNVAKGESGYNAKCDELRGFVFEPLRQYLSDEFAALGWNADKLNEICGTASMAGRHYTARSQWCLPTATHYAKLQAAAHGHLRREYEDLRREYEDLRREYEDLRREYEDLRREYEDLRRPFDVRHGDQYTDVWDFGTVAAYKGKHPCEKPRDMIRHMIEASSKPGDVVLDCFAGSGVTAKAARDAGRKAILCEVDAKWCRVIKHELEQPRLGYSMGVKSVEPPKRDTQRRLIEE